MNNKTHSYPIIVCFTLTLTLPNLAHAIGENCSALLNLGKYNVTQSGSAEDAQALVLSTFCSSDFSKPNTDNQTALIRSAYRFFSDSDPASAPTSDIINAQASVCKGNFDKNSYLQNVPASSKSVYEESVSAWNRCLSLANKGVIFDIQTSSDLLGLDVAMSVQSNSVFVKLNSVTQRGFGKSTCKLNNNGQLTLIDPNKQTPVILSTANKVMVNCERNKNGSSNGQDVYVNQQELVFQTSLDTLTIPLAGTANFSRMSANQLTAQINQQMDSKIAATNSAVAEASKTTDDKVKGLETIVNTKASTSDVLTTQGQITQIQSTISEFQRIESGVWYSQLGDGGTGKGGTGILMQVPTTVADPAYWGGRWECTVIPFKKSFSQVPNVVIGFRQVLTSVPTDTWLRAWSKVEDVTTSQFKLCVGTFAANQIWSNGLNWLAYGR